MTTNIFSVHYPTWIALQLLEDCNLRCKMCYEWGEHGYYKKNNHHDMLNFNVIKKIVEEVSSIKPHFDFFGGEPLLHPSVWDIVSLIKENGSTLEIPTNGTLIRDNIDNIMKTRPDKLWISLDGPEEINDKQRGKGVYKKVCEGIERLKEARTRNNIAYPKIGITFIVTPANYLYLYETYKYFIDNHLLDEISVEFQMFITEKRYLDYKYILQHKFQISQTYSVDGYIQYPDSFSGMNCNLLFEQINHLKDLCNKKNINFHSNPKSMNLDDIKNHFSAKWELTTDYHKKCLFPYRYAEISAKGDVSVCHTFYDITLGNIYQQTLGDIWNGDKMQTFRSLLKKQLLPICPACCNFYHTSNIHFN